ncbi:Protein N-acetyltransferase, RimJ/RimL family [Modicisalibacter muralis]|uniref:Protein N-acetyltransferase, RimJ/RimL family n=1 Tax=Modicisalibacter muralis TaxID=119000 RepID=A0A1G9L1K4_9GAMM|nr:GNAT family protein [Halomonas muralis]SDL55465.1 Protein N-acetyltransferase, RimJ/RimL family [Halomonas muralis]
MTTSRVLEFPAPVGAAVPDWQGAELPERRVLEGRLCRVEPLSAERHGDDLWAAMNLADAEHNWTYLSYGPFADASAYRAWLAEMASREDPLFFAIVDRTTARAVGVASFLRIDAGAGTIEVGHINFSPLLQRRSAASEAMFLMMRYAFALGYRRYEWKCDALNQPSRRAAARLGFTFEGMFRQATVVKGRNRDTAWFSIIDSEWPALEKAFEIWLAADNFDAEGHQYVTLGSLTSPA